MSRRTSTIWIAIFVVATAGLATLFVFSNGRHQDQQGTKHSLLARFTKKDINGDVQIVAAKVRAVSDRGRLGGPIPISKNQSSTSIVMIQDDRNAAKSNSEVNLRPITSEATVNPIDAPKINAESHVFSEQYFAKATHRSHQKMTSNYSGPIYLDWSRPSQLFGYVNYKSLESILSVYPNATVYGCGSNARASTCEII
jgi:hypothetical protein